MDLNLRGLRVLITAGASGIGYEVARGFVREGARVHVCDIDDRALARLRENDPNITSTHADVALRTDVHRLFVEALSQLGGLDVLVNNAGISGPAAEIDQINPDDWDRCIAVNLTGQFNCARLAVPYLKASSNPSIVNVASAAGRLGQAFKTPYVASKWGVIGLTKSLSIELGPAAIRVNAVLPGIVEGDRLTGVIEKKASRAGVSTAEMTRKMLSMVSLGRTVTPKQVADQILFLCSPQGCMTSGQAISICGDLQAIV